MRLPILFFSLGLIGWAIPPDFQAKYRFTNRAGEQTDGVIVYSGATATLPISNSDKGCVGFSLVYDSEGFSVISLLLETSPMFQGGSASGTWSTYGGTSSTGTLPLTSTAQGTYVGYGYYPFLRINLATATGTGSLNVQFSCWKSINYAGATGGNSTTVTDPATQLLKYRTALMNTRDGVADTQILCVGDSITEGIGTTLVSTFPWIGSWPHRLNLGDSTTPQTKSSLGIAFIKNNNYTLGTGWSTLSIGAGFATAGVYTANAAVGTLSYTTGTTEGNYDTYDVYYYKFPGGGNINVVATGGSASGSISTNNGGGALLGKLTVVAASANSTNTVTITNVSGAVSIIAIDARNSGAKLIRIQNAGVTGSLASGAATLSWNTPGNAAALDMIGNFAPNLCLISLGTNDALNVVSKATYKTAMQTIITECELSGDVILIVPPPNNNSTVATLMLTYRDAIYELAVTNNLPVIDIFTRWSKIWQTNLMFDTNHPNNAGYWDIAALVSNTLTSVGGFN